MLVKGSVIFLVTVSETSYLLALMEVPVVTLVEKLQMMLTTERTLYVLFPFLQSQVTRPCLSSFPSLKRPHCSPPSESLGLQSLGY